MRWRRWSSLNPDLEPESGEESIARALRELYDHGGMPGYVDVDPDEVLEDDGDAGEELPVLDMEHARQSALISMNPPRAARPEGQVPHQYSVEFRPATFVDSPRRHRGALPTPVVDWWGRAT